LSRDESKKLIRQRDRMKTEKGLIAKALGLDPADIKIVANDGDDKDENPWKLEAPGIADIAEAVDAHRRKRTVSKTWEDRERELTTNQQRQLERQTESSNKRIEARDRLIQTLAIKQPLIAACVAEGAIDSENDGEFSDVLQLVTKRLRYEIVEEDEDEETHEVAVTAKLIPMNDDGTPMVDTKTGRPSTIRQLVADFLSKRPHFKRSGFMPGPGAGGYGNRTPVPPGATTGAAGPVDHKAAGAAAAAAPF
jgi:hypothetical protein